MDAVTSDGVRIRYDDAGQGEPALLFLSGWCANRTVYEDLAPRCSARRRTLVLDWRGHGGSEVPRGDFGSAQLVEDALAVIGASGARTIIPVALAHSGWVAIELRRRLGDRIPKLVLLEWIVTEAPPPFLDALSGMQSPQRWRQTVEGIFDLWLHGADDPRLTRFVREGMGAYGFDMWSRAAREISAAYTAAGSPLRALAGLQPPVPVLHLCSQPDDPGFLAAQQAFTASHPWFHMQALKTHTHFPMFETPDAIAAAIEQFVGAA